MLALFGPIGTPELVVILIVALLVFGKRLPEVMRNLGKSVNEFKKGMNEVGDQLMEPPAAQAPGYAQQGVKGQDVSAPPSAPVQTESSKPEVPHKTL